LSNFVIIIIIFIIINIIIIQTIFKQCSHTALKLHLHDAKILTYFLEIYKAIDWCHTNHASET